MTFQPAPRKNASVQPLQVAVDHEGEVVQFLTGGHPDRAEGLGLVGLAVTHERPHVRAGGVLDAPRVQVAVEPGLVDRVEWAESHRDGGELPEVGHQPRVRVGRQPATGVGQLLPEAVELGLGQPALEERPGVEARRGVALEEDLVTGLAVVLAAEEVVVSDLVEAGRGRVGGHVPTHAKPRAVGAGHHDGRVPPDVGADPPFDILVAREPRFTFGWDGVDVVGATECRYAHLPFAGSLQ